ncbi:MAG: hypothetical protein ACK415_12765, partial [Thermodesulfovibrionales bacterium]
MRPKMFVFSLLAIALSILFSGVTFAKVSEKERLRIQEAYGRIPLHFIKNNGQVEEKVLFYEKGSGQGVYFTKEGIYLVLTIKEGKSEKETVPH